MGPRPPGEAVQGHASVSEPGDRRAAQSRSRPANRCDGMPGGEWATERIPQIGQIGPATAEDQAWEKRALEMQLEALDRVRSTAEKWAGSISAILGIFGVAAVIEGPDDFSKIEEPYSLIAGVLVFPCRDRGSYRFGPCPSRRPRNT
jgi:hypothetical protein